MYSNQKPLRKAAAEALARQGFKVESLRGSGGARVRLEKDGNSTLALVRTSSDRWVGWMRTDDGEWRGMDDGELVVIAALSASKPGQADIYALAPADVREAFDQNLAAREASLTRLKKTAPIFVSLDEDRRKVSVAAGSGLKLKAKWSDELPLVTATAEPPPASTSQQQPPVAKAAQPSGTVRALLERYKAEIADLLGVESGQVDLQLKVAW